MYRLNSTFYFSPSCFISYNLHPIQLFSFNSNYIEFSISVRDCFGVPNLPSDSRPRAYFGIVFFKIMLKMPPAVFGLWCAFIVFFAMSAHWVSDISILFYFATCRLRSLVCFFCFFFFAMSAFGSLTFRFYFTLIGHLPTGFWCLALWGLLKIGLCFVCFSFCDRFLFSFSVWAICLKGFWYSQLLRFWYH